MGNESFTQFDKSFLNAGTHDPKSQATAGRKGSLFFRGGASGGTVYKKLDEGKTTNWKVIIGEDVIPGVLSNEATIFYVRLDGSDVTGDGSISKPFATIGAAIAATATITLDQGYGPGVLDIDATWEINVGPGYHVCETPMKNFVNLRGASWGTTFLSSGETTRTVWDCPDAPDTEARFEARGIQFINGFEMIRPTGSVEGARARFFECAISSVSQFTGAGLGFDAVEFRECEMFNSTCTYGAMLTTQRNCSTGVSTNNDTGVDAAFTGSQLNMFDTNHRRITINEDSVVNLRNAQLTSQNVIFNGTGGTLKAFDDNSVPNTVVFNTGATAAQIVKSARVAGLGVDGNTGMTTAGNWVGAPPVDFDEALNRIIDVIVTLNGGPLA